VVAVGHLEWVDQAVGLGSEEQVVLRWECRVDLGLAVAEDRQEAVRTWDLKSKIRLPWPC
jgi:hypothetical protein